MSAQLSAPSRFRAAVCCDLLALVADVLPPADARGADMRSLVRVLVHSVFPSVDTDTAAACVHTQRARGSLLPLLLAHPTYFEECARLRLELLRLRQAKLAFARLRRRAAAACGPPPSGDLAAEDAAAGSRAVLGELAHETWALKTLGRCFRSWHQYIRQRKQKRGTMHLLLHSRAHQLAAKAAAKWRQLVRTRRYRRDLAAAQAAAAEYEQLQAEVDAAKRAFVAQLQQLQALQARSHELLEELEGVRTKLRSSNAAGMRSLVEGLAGGVLDAARLWGRIARYLAGPGRRAPSTARAVAAGQGARPSLGDVLDQLTHLTDAVSVLVAAPGTAAPAALPPARAGLALPTDVPPVPSLPTVPLLCRLAAGEVELGWLAPLPTPDSVRQHRATDGSESTPVTVLPVLHSSKGLLCIARALALPPARLTIITASSAGHHLAAWCNCMLQGKQLSLALGGCRLARLSPAAATRAQQCPTRPAKRSRCAVPTLGHWRTWMPPRWPQLSTGLRAPWRRWRRAGVTAQSGARGRKCRSQTTTRATPTRMRRRWKRQPRRICPLWGRRG